MFDLEVLGPQIVKELSTLIEQSVVVTDRTGFIIASTDPQRLNTFHEGASLSIKNLKQLHMTEEMCKKLKGVRPGMVMPIVIEDQAIGVIGITGTPKTVEKYAKLVKKVVELFVTDFLSRQQRERSVRELEYFVSDYFLKKLSDLETTKKAKLLGFPIENFCRIAILQGSQYIDQEVVERMKNNQTIHPELMIVRSGLGQLIFFIPEVEKNQLMSSFERMEMQLMKVYEDFQPIGIGQAGDLKRSFLQAQTAINISIRQKKIVFEEDLKLELLYYELSDDCIKTFVSRTIEPILEDKELFDTLEVYFNDNGGLQEIADKLFIHKNTLKYRLSKIESLLSIQMSNRAHLAEIYTAYRLYKRV
ncbi:CdaR family transcriptional regulator [Psychrobacillus antarcticus]|uniref:CdaR family transcriptional regulator n=1 Tax=Psychrobacillus antarcticus TaxID=2879115 RepID=UPI002408120D|nr:sugar diacid recognition domain-containing protein [Psychrobacillus antarcticus]